MLTSCRRVSVKRHFIFTRLIKQCLFSIHHLEISKRVDYNDKSKETESFLTEKSNYGAYPGACMRPMMAAEEERPHTRYKMVCCSAAGNYAATRRRARDRWLVRFWSTFKPLTRIWQGFQINLHYHLNHYLVTGRLHILMSAYLFPKMTYITKYNLLKNFIECFNRISKPCATFLFFCVYFWIDQKTRYFIIKCHLSNHNLHKMLVRTEYLFIIHS